MGCTVFCELAASADPIAASILRREIAGVLISLTA
jgi:hypothetical protein